MERHGGNFYQLIGSRGGRNGSTGGFYANPELAKRAGAKGGSNGHRFPTLAMDEILNDAHRVELQEIILAAAFMKKIKSGKEPGISDKVVNDIIACCSSNRWFKLFVCRYVDSADFKALFTYRMNEINSKKRDYTSEKNIVGSLRLIASKVTGYKLYTTSKYDIQLAGECIFKAGLRLF